MVMRELRRNYSYHGIVYEANIAFRRRSGIRLSIRKDGRLSISAPRRISLTDLDQEIGKMMPWVEKHRSKMEQEQALPYTYILGERVETSQSEDEVRSGYAKQALAYFTSRVAYFAPIMGIKTPYKVKVRAHFAPVLNNQGFFQGLVNSLGGASEGTFSETFTPGSEDGFLIRFISFIADVYRIVTE